MKFVASALALLSALTLTAAQPSIGDVLQDPDFSTLLAALQLTGLDTVLVGGSDLTVFAPNNAAFDAFMSYSPGTMDFLLAESPPDTLTYILLHHAADGVVTSRDIVDGMIVNMLSNDNVTLTEDPPMVDNSNIIAADIDVQEGVVHVIDFPLVPSELNILPGIFFLANSTGQFTTLLRLIESVGLSENLNTAGPFTVFAPTDEAFAKIPNFAEIAMDPAAVIGILTGHVVGGYVTSDMLSDGQVLTALGQQELTVMIMGSTVMISGATVTQADLMGSNGVIHVIDTVIIPVPSTPTSSPAPTAAPVPTMEPMPTPEGMATPEPTPTPSAAAAKNWAVVGVATAMVYSMLA